MPNLGLQVDLPATFVDELDVDQATFDRISAIDAEAAIDVQRAMLGEIRFEPGGDFGLEAIDPTTGIEFLANFGEDAEPGDDLLARLVDGVGDMAIEPKETGETDILGRPAALFESFVKGYKPPRRAVDVAFRLPSGRTIHAVVQGHGDKFDRAYAARIFATFRETDRQPLGEPFIPVEDQQLSVLLARMPNTYMTFAGDVKAMKFFGEYQRGPFKFVIDSVPDLRLNPGRLRGGAAGIFGGGMLHVVRIDGDLSPDWDAVIDEYVAGGMTLEEDLGPEVYAAFIAGEPKMYVAAFAQGPYLFQVLARSKDDLKKIVSDAMQLSGGP